MKSVSILGCGWLGLPLGTHLSKIGYAVKGSTTRQEKFSHLLDAGIEPYQLELPLWSNQDSLDDFFRCHHLVIAIPPQVRTKGEDFHLQQLESIRAYLTLPQQLIYISSTSVYPPQAGTYTEEYPVNPGNTGNPTLLKAETFLRELRSDCQVIRMGGLMGDDRIPGKRQPGQLPPQAGSPVNYIHQQDALGLLLALIDQPTDVCLLNGVAPQHPTRQQVYRQAARQQEWPIPPRPEESQGTPRIISSTRLGSRLRFTFNYPDPLQFSYRKENPGK